MPATRTALLAAAVAALLAAGPALARTVTAIAEGPALNFPSDMAVDGAGNTYITVAGGRDKVVRITDSPPEVSVILDGTGDGTNPLHSAIEVAVDTDGNVYVVSWGSPDGATAMDAIFCISQPGESTQQIVQILDEDVPLVSPDGMDVPQRLDSPRELELGPTHLYVVGDWIVQIPLGCARPTPGTAVAIANVVSDETWIQVDATGDLYVAEEYGGEIFVLEDPGTPLQSKTVLLPGTAGFLPYGLVLDASGTLFFDQRAFEPGSYCLSPGGMPVEIPYFGYIDGDGNHLFVASSLGGDSLVRVPGPFVGCEPAPGPIQMTPLPPDPVDRPFRVRGLVQVGARGTDAYVYPGGFERIFRVDDAGNVTLLADNASVGSTLELREPTRMALDGSGTLYVAAERSSNVFRIDAPGSAGQQIVEVLPWTGDGINRFIGARSVATDASGRLFAASDQSIFCITDPGSPSPSTSLVSDLGSHRIVADDNGRLFVAVGDEVRAISSPCSASPTVETILDSGDGLDGSRGLAMGPDGTLCVASEESDTGLLRI